MPRPRRNQVAISLSAGRIDAGEEERRSRSAAGSPPPGPCATGASAFAGGRAGERRQKMTTRGRRRSGEVEDRRDQRAGDEAELHRRSSARSLPAPGERPVVAELGHDRRGREPRRHRADECDREHCERPFRCGRGRSSDALGPDKRFPFEHGRAVLVYHRGPETRDRLVLPRLQHLDLGSELGGTCGVSRAPSFRGLAFRPRPG